LSSSNDIPEHRTARLYPYRPCWFGQVEAHTKPGLQ
jgi:hypothetical protein